MTNANTKKLPCVDNNKKMHDFLEYINTNVSIKEAKKFLITNNMDINIQDIVGNTLLHRLVLTPKPDKTKQIKLVLRIGIDPNIPDFPSPPHYIDAETPLDYLTNTFTKGVSNDPYIDLLLERDNVDFTRHFRSLCDKFNLAKNKELKQYLMRRIIRVFHKRRPNFIYKTDTNNNIKINNIIITQRSLEIYGCGGMV